MRAFYQRLCGGGKPGNDPEYIIRLVGQVVRVSLETVRIVNALPEQFAEKTT
jgi:hypothetical protein